MTAALRVGAFLASHDPAAWLLATAEEAARAGDYRAASKAYRELARIADRIDTKAARATLERLALDALERGDVRGCAALFGLLVKLCGAEVGLEVWSALLARPEADVTLRRWLARRFVSEGRHIPDAAPPDLHEAGAVFRRGGSTALDRWVSAWAPAPPRRKLRQGDLPSEADAAAQAPDSGPPWPRSRSGDVGPSDPPFSGQPEGKSAGLSGEVGCHSPGAAAELNSAEQASTHRPKGTA